MHNYIKYEIMLKEINLDNKNIIIPKLSDYNYLSDFVKVFALKYIDICNSSTKIYSLLFEKYGIIKINYNKIAKEEKDNIIKLYIKKKKLKIIILRLKML